MQVAAADCLQMFEVLPIEAFAINADGGILYANSKARELLPTVDDTNFPSFFSIWNDNEDEVRSLTRRCAGSSNWQPVTLKYRTGSLQGSSIKLKGRGLLLDGSPNPVTLLVADSQRGYPFEEHTRLVRALNTELAQLRDTEARLNVSLSNERRLHRELIHRVKNNLSVLSSLISQRASASRNPEVALALTDIQSRIRSLAIIHQLLDQTQSIDVIDGAAMIDTLCKDLESALCPPGVSIIRDLDSEPLHVVDATPLLLVVNELVTNALKHAFEGQTSGEVKVSLRQNGVDKLEVSIADNGKGIDEISEQLGSGRKIITALASQLDGQITVKSNKGTSWLLVFPRTNLSAPE